MSRLARIGKAVGLSLFVLFTAGTFVFSAASAQAATGIRTAGGPSINCGAQVDDMTTGHVVTTSAVTQAASQLAGHGPTVYVVVYDGSANGSSAQYAQSLIAQCPQWTLNDPTQIAPNVILLVMDLHHHITIRDGSDYNGKLDQQLGSIVHNAASSYDSGNYADATASLLNGISGTLYPGIDWALWITIGVIVVVVLIGACINGASTSSNGDGFWYGFFFANMTNGSGSGGSSYSGGGYSGGGSGGGGGFSGSI